MSLELPKSGDVFIPEVPSSLQKDNKEMYNFLVQLKRTLEPTLRGLFANDSLIADAVNLGVSGSFVISSGGHIVVTSGIVTAVTS